LVHSVTYLKHDERNRCTPKLIRKRGENAKGEELKSGLRKVKFSGWKRKAKDHVPEREKRNTETKELTQEAATRGQKEHRDFIKRGGLSLVRNGGMSSGCTDG